MDSPFPLLKGTLPGSDSWDSYRGLLQLQVEAVQGNAGDLDGRGGARENLAIVLTFLNCQA